MKKTILPALALLATVSLDAKPLKVRVIQPYFSLEDGGFVKSWRWEVEQLRKCDARLDLIVLPEFSDVPGKATNDEFYAQLESEGAAYREILSETAKRCGAIVCAGCVELTEQGPRNTTFVFNRDGTLVGRYNKQHLTRGEWANRGFDRSYTLEWSAPDIIEVDGLRLAFLTCYDFYFYENFSNIARYKPDIIIGCSNQRSDPHNILSIINTFCAYNIGAYLVRASVSMGEKSPVGGCSCVVAPTGEILGNLYSRQAVLDAEFDPFVKYLKPAGYGNPPSLHSEYMEIGRRPMKYRQGGSAIVPFADEVPARRIAALNGMNLCGRDLMARIGAAVGVSATEIFLSVVPSREGPSVEYPSGNVPLMDVLKKFACHTILNLKLEGKWDNESLKQLRSMLFDCDALRHLCLTLSSGEMFDSAEAIFPGVPRCILLSMRDLTPKTVSSAHESGLRVCTVCRKRSADKLFSLGVDTVVASNF